MDSSLQLIVLVICASQVFTNVNGLMCSKCLAINCEDEDLECQRTRSFIELELKSMYYFEGSLESCPTTGYRWNIMLTNTLEHCPEEKPGEATCALGRIQVKTTHIAPGGGRNTTTYYATIVGCAKRILMKNIKSQYDQGKPCYIYKNMQETKETREMKVVRMLEVENCRDVDKYCHERDFCLDKRQSTIRYWQNSMRKGFASSFLYSYGFYILVGFVAVILLAIAVGTLCGDCNIPFIIKKEVPASTAEDSKVGKAVKVFRQAIPASADKKVDVSCKNNVNVAEPEIENRPAPAADNQVQRKMSNEYGVNVKEIKNRFETVEFKTGNKQMSNGNNIVYERDMPVFKTKLSTVV